MYALDIVSSLLVCLSSYDSYSWQHRLVDAFFDLINPFKPIGITQSFKMYQFISVLRPTKVYLLDFFCCGIQFYLLLSPYLCFISFLYLDLCVLGDDVLIS